MEWPLWWEQFPSELSEAAPQLPEADVAALTQALSTEGARRVFQVRVGDKGRKFQQFSNAAPSRQALTA